MNRFTYKQPRIVQQMQSGSFPFFNGATERVLRGIEDGTFGNDREVDLDVYLPSKGKNLQRGVVWNVEQKREFIKSLFRGVQIPNFACLTIYARGGKTIYKIIDGKQRLSAIFAFVRNEFNIIAPNGEAVFFKDLNSDERLAFKQAINSLRVNEAIYGEEESLDDDTIIEWFVFLNFAGTPQDTAHIENLLK